LNILLLQVVAVVHNQETLLVEAAVEQVVIVPLLSVRHQVAVHLLNQN
tara:strand:- start:658 stop:801 length:144 start_codon:yes stop_codon:yes gene_type:complete